jgi:DhnA family fructose-bisphosphate aldolase class Ia
MANAAMLTALTDLGRQHRLNRLLSGSTPRALVVAIDHGLFMGPVSGANVLAETLAAVIAAGPDGVQLTPGGIGRAGDLLAAPRPALVYRLDTTNVWRAERLAPSPGYWAPVGTPAEAVGVDAAVAVAFLLGQWGDDHMERDNVEQLARWSRECRSLGMPFMIEPLPLSGKVETRLDGRLVRSLARIASEIGCDLLKLDFDGDAEAFAELVADAAVPVLVRGGPRAANRDAYLSSMRTALAAGASGLVVGRNVFDGIDPRQAIHELLAVIHDTR